MLLLQIVRVHEETPTEWEGWRRPHRRGRASSADQHAAACPPCRTMCSPVWVYFMQVPGKPVTLCMHIEQVPETAGHVAVTVDGASTSVVEDAEPDVQEEQVELVAERIEALRAKQEDEVCG